MLLLLALALIAGEVGDVEQAIWVGAVDALGGEGLDVAVDLVLEGNALVERVELVVVVVDGGGVGEVDGEDADALGSCATLLETCSNQQRRMRRMTYTYWSARLHRGHWNAAATTHAGTAVNHDGAEPKVTHG